MQKTLRPKQQGILKLEHEFKTKRSEYWSDIGQKNTVKLAQNTLQSVPAYTDFIKKSGLKIKKITSFKDFLFLPIIDKENYLNSYPLPMLCPGGILKNQHWVISATSGSSGKPFYFPRRRAQDLQYAETAELYLRSNFDIQKKTTLYINCFALGVWIGGLFTYEAIKIVAERGNYPLSIINPGLNKGEIFKAIKALGKQFDQIIIGGYPPFIKDIIDEAIYEKISWRDYTIKFIFSAEGFSEQFRDYIAKKTGIKNIYKDTLNHYGTVDLGTMAHETPICILIRRLALSKKNLYKKLFGSSGLLPTLAQYDPKVFFFEEVRKILICTAASGLPLIRYNLKDRGGIFTFDKIEKIFSEENINLKKESTKAGISRSIWKLPFVYVYERDDFTVSWYGANIHPETIKKALEAKVPGKFLTGKFTMRIAFDKQQSQKLEVNIELKRGVKKSSGLSVVLTKIIRQRLATENSEYRNNVSSMGEKMKPKVILWTYEHPLYFEKKGKQKWIKK